MSLQTEPSLSKQFSMPVDSYLVLEKLISRLRLRVLQSVSKHAKHNLTAVEITAALNEVARVRQGKADVARKAKDALGVGRVPKESLRCLVEQRLHHLRVAVIAEAQSIAAHNVTTEISPSMLESAWDTIINSQLLDAILQLN